MVKKKSRCKSNIWTIIEATIIILLFIAYDLGYYYFMGDVDMPAFEQAWQHCFVGGDLVTFPGAFYLEWIFDYMLRALFLLVGNHIVAAFWLQFAIIVIAIFMNYNKEKTYYATFIVDNEKYQSKVLIEDGYISRLPETPKKEGYVFDYWEIDGKKYTGLEKITDDIILTAVFKKVDKNEVIVITFNKDNGEDNSTIEIIKNDKVTPISEPEKEGYNFVGWYLNDMYFSFDTPIEENITLTAKWEAIVYIIKFDTKGGNKISDKVVEYKKQVIAPTSPTKEGYKFLGWYLNDKKYDFNTKVTKDITLIAKWEKVEEKIAYGDVNEDGIINSLDVLRLMKYLEKGEKISEQAKKNADVNGDGKVNYVDIPLIMQILSNDNEKPLDSPIKDYALHGDLNEDGLLTKEDYDKLNLYLLNNIDLSNQAKKNADVNGNGTIDEVDLKNLKARLDKNTTADNKVIASAPIIDYIVYGDVNEDGKINGDDVTLLRQYREGKIKLSVQGSSNANVNGDNTLGYVDIHLLLRFVSGWYENTLPLKPITDYVFYGDIYEDGEVNVADYTKLRNYLQNPSSTTLSEQIKRNIDVNEDGAINFADLVLIDAFNSGWYKNTLPNSSIKEYVLYGDLTEDGLLTQEDYDKLNLYLSNNINLSNQAKKNADVNGNGTIDEIDLKNLKNRLIKYEDNKLENYKKVADLNPIVDYIVYGDVNEDREINSRDALQIGRYLKNEVELSAQAKKNADVNNDGQINNADAVLITREATGAYENTLPSKPIEDYVMYGDLTEDGIINNDDLKLFSSFLNQGEAINAQSYKNADVNNNGKVDKEDYDLLTKYIAEHSDGAIPSSPLS